MLSSYESGFDNDQDNLGEQGLRGPGTANSRQPEAAGNRTATRLTSFASWDPIGDRRTVAERQVRISVQATESRWCVRPLDRARQPDRPRTQAAGTRGRDASSGTDNDTSDVAHSPRMW